MIVHPALLRSLSLQSPGSRRLDDVRCFGELMKSPLPSAAMDQERASLRANYYGMSLNTSFE